MVALAILHALQEPVYCIYLFVLYLDILTYHMPLLQAVII
jgi:hypothetical protein